MLNILRRSPAQKSQDRVAGKNYGPGKRDALTGAVNKSAFQKIVEDALAGEHMQGCLLLVDVDHMLQAVYATLREYFRGEDGIGRLSEDTFGIWIEGLSADQLGGIRRRIAVVNDRLLHGDRDMPTVTLSAGAALGESGESYKEMYRQAQKVLYRVKEGGRCGCEIYTT